MGTNTGKLMHPRKATQNDPIPHMHMPRQSGIIGKNGVIADLAVVGNMHIGHHPVVIANPGDPFVLRCTGIKSAKLANSIAIANFQTRGLTGIFFILRLRPQRSKLKNLVIAPNAGMALNHAMRPNARAFTNLNVRANNAVRAHRYRWVHHGTFGNQSGRVNVLRHRQPLTPACPAYQGQRSAWYTSARLRKRFHRRHVQHL